MKNILIIALMILSFTSCNEVIEGNYVTGNNDTIARDYLITDARVGRVRKGMNARSLYRIYGEKSVKLLLKKNNNEIGDTVLNNEQSYYVYDSLNHLLFIAQASDIKGNDQIIERIIIKNKKFRTTKNIGIGSDVAQICEKYNDATIIQSQQDVYLFIPSIDAYFTINSKMVRGYNPDFLTDVPVDSVMPNTKPLNFDINWYTQEAGVFSGKFWKDMLHKFLKWIIIELPSILILIALFTGLMRLLRFVVKRLKLLAIRRAENDLEIDTSEATKRINTLSGIVNGIGRIILWAIFLLILLSKININIGPILASAGIVGLAVGFGAQELVRDFISGFFILLEDQLRTGDVAIINGTTGLVEKIELRTITLRDFSGVVHIFQNGKINSLSNMTKEWSAIVLEIGVAYKENIDSVMAVMRRVGQEMSNTPEYGVNMLNGVDVMGLDKFADSAIIIKATIKTRPMQQWAIKREYQRRLKIAFDAEGIEIPFPHLSIYTGEATKPMPVVIDKL